MWTIGSKTFALSEMRMYGRAEVSKVQSSSVHHHIGLDTRVLVVACHPLLGRWGGGGGGG